MDIRSTATVSPLPAEKFAPPAKPAESARAAAAVAAAIQPGEPHDSNAALDKAVENINTVLSVRSQSLEFKVDDDNRTIVTVIDKETQEVIRQMPSKEALEIAKALDHLQSLLSKQTA